MIFVYLALTIGSAATLANGLDILAESTEAPVTFLDLWVKHFVGAYDCDNA